MNTKDSAYYQRKYRARQRELGLVKREIWVHPDNVELVRGIEKDLREATKDQQESESRPRWTTPAIYAALEKSELCIAPEGGEGRAHLELFEGVEPIIHLQMKEFGDLPVYVSVAGGQILAECVLWPRLSVSDQRLFDETVLRTHKFFPLSTICLEKRSDDDYYMMFGSLSATASLRDIMHEIDELALNVINATEMYDNLLKPTES